MPTSCKIWLRNDTDKVYYCGEKLEGNVELTVTEPKKMTGIRLIIAGVATVEWFHYRGPKRARPFKGSEACFDSEIDLLGANGVHRSGVLGKVSQLIKAYFLNGPFQSSGFIFQKCCYSDAPNIGQSLNPDISFLLKWLSTMHRYQHVRCELPEHGGTAAGWYLRNQNNAQRPEIDFKWYFEIHDGGFRFLENSLKWPYTIQYGYFLQGCEEMDVPAGTTSYSFDCFLPDSLPATFEGKYGRIQYIITVILQRAGKVDKTFTIDFIVLRNVDLNAEPSAIRRPARTETSQTFRCWPCRSGPLLVEMQTSATGYVAGQRIPVVLEVSNRSGCKIHSIQLKLVMVVAYTSDTPRVKVKTVREDVVLAELEQVEDPEVVRYEESLLVPPTPVTSASDSCKIIQIVYELEAELEVGALHQTVKLNIPIVIGTIALDADRRESTIMELES